MREKALGTFNLLCEHFYQQKYLVGNIIWVENTLKLFVLDMICGMRKPVNRFEMKTVRIGVAENTLSCLLTLVQVFFIRSCFCADGKAKRASILRNVFFLMPL